MEKQVTALPTLIDVVKGYSEFGHHRTGSDVDVNTVEWLVRLLAGIGASIETPEFDYQHFEWEVDGAARFGLEILPLYYSFHGAHRVESVLVSAVNGHASEEVIGKEIQAAATSAAKQGCDGVILGTDCPTQEICAINRPIFDGYEVPVFLVSPKHANRIAFQEIDIECFANLRPRKARNIVARFPVVTGAPTLIVTTPFSGWFNCAGERGTGVAIALAAAHQISKKINVELLFASGHELGFAGGFALEASYRGSADAILHIGSCIANFDASFDVNCSADFDQAACANDHLKTIGLVAQNPDDPETITRWSGESECWANCGLPMLSIAGIAPNFHTASDLPDKSVDAKMLERSCDAIAKAAMAMTM